MWTVNLNIKMIRIEGVKNGYKGGQVRCVHETVWTAVEKD